MEQVKRERAHLERVLLVCGDQNAGKSRLLRHMLGDARLGGDVPTSPRVRARALSRERCLTVRFASPHEHGDTQSEFLRKIDRACEVAWWQFFRINYACAVQPRAAQRMPGIVETCQGLIKALAPERIRVVQLAPNQWGNDNSRLTHAEIDGLRDIDVEVVAIDARRSTGSIEQGNVRILADYFDFS